MPLSLITLTDWGFETLKSGDRTCIQLACLMVSRTIKMASENVRTLSEKSR